MPSDDISRMYSFMAGTYALAAEVNSEFNQLVSTINNKVGRATVETISGNKTLSGTVLVSGAATFSNTVVMNNTVTLSGTMNVTGALNLGRSADAGSPSNGDVWLNTTSSLLKSRINGSTVTLNPPNDVNNFRLTLASGTPYTITDQTAKTTIYLTPNGGNWISLYDGTNWVNRSSAEISVAVPATTNTPFDIFAYDNAGTVALETANWTNDTTRATALIYQNGVLVKSGATTRRYLGTGRTTGVSGQTESSFAKQFLWNINQQKNRLARGTFSTTRTITSTSYAQVNSEIQAQFVLGLAEDTVRASFNGTVNTPTGSTAMTGIAFDSTTVPEPGFTVGTGNSSGSTLNITTAVSNAKLDLAAGYHYGTILGASSTGATQGWSSADTPASALAKGYLTIEFRG